MGIDYSHYDDKGLVSMYIFNYPLNSYDTELREELRKRGLFEWAQQMFNKLYGIFNDEWDKRVNEA